jgi:two-component system, OmpR family, response regulator PfeR
VPAARLDPRPARGGPPSVPVIACGPPGLLQSAFLAGCADYLRDPWTPDELAIRALAILGRAPRRHLFPWGVLRLQGCSLRGPGARVELTAVEARILEALLAGRGSPVPREALALCAWGRPAPRGSRALDMHVSCIRRKVRDAFPASGPRFITSVRGEGYLVP